MKTFLDRLTFNAEGAAGGGGAAAVAASSGDAAAAAAAGVSAAGSAPSGAAAAAADGAPPASSAASAAVEIYKPEGLADHMLGKSNNETIDNLKKALDGYRVRDAEQKVPDKAEAYGVFEGEIPAELKPYMDTLVADPLSARMQQYALDNRVPLPVYQGFVKQFLSVSAEMGMMEPVVDAAAERAALLPDTAKHLPETEQKAAIERRMTDNFSFIDAMAQRGADNGGLSKDDAEFAKAMLGDSAKGHRFFEWVRSQAGAGASKGGPAMDVSGGGSGGDPKADLRRRGGLPANTVGHKEFDRASYDQLQSDYKRVYGN